MEKDLIGLCIRVRLKEPTTFTWNSSDKLIFAQHSYFHFWLVADSLIPLWYTTFLHSWSTLTTKLRHVFWCNELENTDTVNIRIPCKGSFVVHKAEATVAEHSPDWADLFFLLLIPHVSCQAVWNNWPPGGHILIMPSCAWSMSRKPSDIVPIPIRINRTNLTTFNRAIFLAIFSENFSISLDTWLRQTEKLKHVYSSTMTRLMFWQSCAFSLIKSKLDRSLANDGKNGQLWSHWLCWDRCCLKHVDRNLAWSHSGASLKAHKPLPQAIHCANTDASNITPFRSRKYIYNLCFLYVFCFIENISPFWTKWLFNYEMWSSNNTVLGNKAETLKFLSTWNKHFRNFKWWSSCDCFISSSKIVRAEVEDISNMIMSAPTPTCLYGTILFLTFRITIFDDCKFEKVKASVSEQRIWTFIRMCEGCHFK